MTRILLLTLALALTAFAPASAQDAKNKLDSLFADSVVAKGKGFEIKRTELDAMVISLKSAAAGRGQTPPPDFEKIVLQNLISLRVLLQKATDADKAKGREQFTSGLERAKTNSQLSDEEFNERLNRQIKAQGLTKAEWEKQGVEQATIQAMAERELKIEISDDAAKKFYDENPARFEQPEMVRVSHVLISTQDPSTRQDYGAEKKVAQHKIAEDVLKRAKAGEDFAKLAKEFSDDPGSKSTGGEYKFGRGQMVPEFEAASFALKTNEVSDIVTTQFGYHIIKSSEKIPAKKVEFATISKDLKEALKRQEFEKQFPEFLEKQLDAADIEVLDEKLKLPPDAFRRKTDSKSETKPDAVPEKESAAKDKDPKK